jgi:hypothetical protein
MSKQERQCEPIGVRVSFAALYSSAAKKPRVWARREGCKL